VPFTSSSITLKKVNNYKPGAGIAAFGENEAGSFENMRPPNEVILVCFKTFFCFA